jgi:hypothetical protein
MADIKPGMFVGSTGMTHGDGSQRTIEVHICPESMRRTGEGHYDWDLKPQSKMTNANVQPTVAGVDTVGRPPWRLDFQHQHSRKHARCQRTIVLGFTTAGASQIFGNNR